MEQYLRVPKRPRDPNVRQIAWRVNRSRAATRESAGEARGNAASCEIASPENLRVLELHAFKTTIPGRNTCVTVTWPRVVCL